MDSTIPHKRAALITVLLTTIAISGCQQPQLVRATDGTLLESYRYCEEQPNPAYTTSGETTNRLVGTVIGGVIGNQFGRGKGRTAMTALGAIAGASAAHPAPTTTNCTTRYREVPVDY